MIYINIINKSNPKIPIFDQFKNKPTNQFIILEKEVKKEH